ncbi:MAG: aminotransferase class I/II-fold pyridoxal phosphate-dependent enzyme [Clostridiales bacterium]|nr:aminotransferase class I/II-fold pyridoxal phosphate-dependent enzyme [Clostridiales bacterium]
MQAIILAAGMGKRLKELTRNNTKCMVRVNGKTLIERLLGQLESRGLSRIVIVIGYEGKKLKDYVGTLGIRTPVVFIENPVYDRTNNIYSLALAKSWLTEEDTLLFESDLLFEDSVLDELISDPRDTLALVDRYESWMDGTCVRLTEDDRIEEFISGKKLVYAHQNEYFKTVNIYKFSRHFSQTYYVPFLEAYQSALGENEYYEQVLRVITMLDDPVIQAKRLNGQKWYEIDDAQDLDIAESIFEPDPEEKVKRFQRRYGGYWRYPKLLDFCYLVNPYFPPARMTEEIRASLETLLTEYPSGMGVNSLLAAKNFGVRAENILVGNGAAELIRSLMGMLQGKAGFVRPTFEEYPGRYDPAQSVIYTPQNPDFSCSAQDLISFFGDKDIRTLVVVNPDNPSGNYLSTAEMRRLIGWTADQGIRLVVDESFVDFAEEADSSLIRPSVLENSPHLLIMKSISKSYGVPGLRLGVLASGDREIIARLKKDVAVWNINSFAEFYLQIAEKYQKDYEDALVRIRQERARFAGELRRIPGIRVIPSQANFLMVELTNGYPAPELVRNLLTRYEILIKDLTAKTAGGNYLRLAVRNTEDNNRLLQALRRELAGRKDSSHDA